MSCAINTKGKVWSESAIACYERGCNCQGCYYTEFFEGSGHKCHMNVYVTELVKLLGRPCQKKSELNRNQQAIYNLLSSRDRITTLEIFEEIGINRNYASTIIRELTDLGIKIKKYTAWEGRGKHTKRVKGYHLYYELVRE